MTSENHRAILNKGNQEHRKSFKATNIIYSIIQLIKEYSHVNKHINSQTMNPRYNKYLHHHLITKSIHIIHNSSPSLQVHKYPQCSHIHVHIFIYKHIIEYTTLTEIHMHAMFYTWLYMHVVPFEYRNSITEGSNIIFRIVLSSNNNP